jgi:prolycopene isomerase
MSAKYDYDAIIIGAGIGGLVCGCYLAKAGLKTLIVEKNEKPGGYCTSFTRDGFLFDACVHSLGSCGEGGIIFDIMKDLSIFKKIEMQRFDPSDIIISPDFKISFWNKLDEVIQEFQTTFPKEAKRIKDFFIYLNNASGRSLAQLRNKNFQYILDNYFSDYRLKSALSIFVLGNIGLPPSRLSAFTGIKFYKQFMLDGGYYPRGGMQEFSNILAGKFKEYGGTLKIPNSAKRIKVNNNKIEGVIIDEAKFISSKYVVSGCDVVQTFIDLIGKKNTSQEISSKLNSMTPSLSMFILYLGLDNDVAALPCVGTNLWFMPNYDMENMYLNVRAWRVNKIDFFLVRVINDKRSIIVLINAPFNDEKYWATNKEKLREIFINKIDKIIPGISQHIVFKEIATPITLYKRTLNYKGAAYGWESSPDQFAIREFGQHTPIENLYLTGHWTTLAQGIPGVAYLGRDTAKLIINRGLKRA